MASVAVLGAGAYLPPSQSVIDLAKGADTSGYDGWPRACIAGEDDHPSTMGAKATLAALADAGVRKEQLKLVVSCGMSREYLLAWSVATEIIRLMGIPSACLGLDINVGCTGLMAGLEVARSWLLANGGGYAAVVSADRQSSQIDRGDPESERIWAMSDGAAAVILGLGAKEPARAHYRGSCFSTHPDFNDVLLPPCGGTRRPAAPDGRNLLVFRSPPTKKELFDVLRAEYLKVMRDVLRQYGSKPEYLVCVQLSPKFVSMLREFARMDENQVIRTGDEVGHACGADIALGIQKLLSRGPLRGDALLVSGTLYAFAAGLLQPRSA
jgi:3-oxoacyl-[acyl-carrier-protein] synthase III